MELRIYQLKNGEMVIGSFDESSSTVLKDCFLVTLTSQNNQGSLGFIPISYPINDNPIDLEISRLDYFVFYTEFNNVNIKNIKSLYESTVAKLKGQLISPDTPKLVLPSYM